MKFLYTKNNVYKTRYFIYTYNNNDIRLVKIKSCRLPDFEEQKSLGTFDYNSDEVSRISLSRTRRNIREIALCNQFEYFVTLTISSELGDRYSLDDCQNKLKKILKKIKRNNKDFRYIFITEKHKDGAFHFHGLVSNFDDLYINDNGYYCSYIFSKELGFNSFSKIKDYTKCCNYITKYITKDCVKNSHNQVYISSRGLKKATREEFSILDFTPSFSNDYCEIKDIQIDKLSFDEKMKFFQIREGK